MRLKLLSLFAALLLLGACETAPSGEAGAGGEGASADGTSAGGTSVSADTLAPAPAPGTQEHLVLEAGDRVFFDFDKYDLKDEAQATLKRQAAWLKQHTNISITVEGHCDERGTREYNLALGERRSNAVKDYLVALGVKAGRVATVSYGKERPAVLGSNEWGWAQNRRGVSVVN